jgi:hypothetical protein
MKAASKLIGMLACILAAWVLGFSGMHPEFHDFSDAKEVIIKVHPRNEIGWPSESYKRDGSYKTAYYERRITDAQEIKALEDVLGVTWDGIFPLHSYETGTTTCSITIVRKNGQKTILLFSEDEWGSAGRPPERIKRYIKTLMS